MRSTRFICFRDTKENKYIENLPLTNKHCRVMVFGIGSLCRKLPSVTHIVEQSAFAYRIVGQTFQAFRNISLRITTLTLHLNRKSACIYLWSIFVDVSFVYYAWHILFRCQPRMLQILLSNIDIKDFMFVARIYT